MSVNIKKNYGIQISQKTYKKKVLKEPVPLQLGWNFVPSIGTCTKSAELQTLRIILVLAYVLYCLSAVRLQLQKNEQSLRK